MSSQERIEQLFGTAQALEIGERDAYLQRECGNDKDLVRRVHALLNAADQADAYFSNLVGRMSALALSRESNADTAGLGPGDQVGPYTVLEMLGIGGMGEVWRAQRSDRLIERFVALKLPHGTWQRRGLAERMAQERAILATLDHPNIARLLDTGITEQGQPYLAIEYVEGVALDQYCRDRKSTIADRLKLFLQVVDAIAYAHAKLIVHRDLKPQNILVTASGEVRLLDFGIAKLLADGPGTPSPLTQFAGHALTPDYAAPEQILGEPITVAVDVYSLGIVLYELLTERRPYNMSSTAPGALQEAISKIELTLPSRSTADESTRRELRGDLDTIVAKALKKDPRERYATANALAEDVIRYLERRPVLARPDSALYRTRKFMQRHRVGVAASALIAIALLTATAVSIRSAQLANEQSQRIALERERADGIKNFLIDMLKGADPNFAPADVTVKALVQERFTTIKDRFNDDPATKIELLQVFADVFEVLRLSDLEKQAVDMQLALLRERSGGESSTAYATALAQRARAEEHKGDYESAFGSVRSALRINTALNDQKGIAANQHQLGLLHHFKGEFEPAATFYEQALAIRRAEYGEDSLEYVDTLYELGELHTETGEYEQAELELRRVLAVRERLLGARHSEVAQVLTALGGNLGFQRPKLDEAIATNEKALALYASLFGPDNRYANLAVNNLAYDYRRKGDTTRALEYFAKTLELTRKFYPGHPDEGIVLVNIADLLYFEPNYPAALENYQQSMKIFVAHMPDHPKIHMMNLRIGLCLGYTKRFAEAERYFEPAFANIKSNTDIFTPKMVREAAQEIVSVYTAWGRRDKIALYQAYLADSG